MNIAHSVGSQSALALEHLPFAAWVAHANGSWHDSNEAALTKRDALVQCSALTHAITHAIECQEPTNLRNMDVAAIGSCTLWIQPLPSSQTALVLCEPTPAHAQQDTLDKHTDLSAHMVASLAHEIRNPLLSIRGAAQLLASVVPEDDKPLADLIAQETKRIDALMATLDPLTAAPKSGMEAVNIHEVLEYVRLAAEASFARHVTFVMDYDPSLPALHGHRERLIQMLMNLVKNAAEACGGHENATINLRTRYAFGEQRQRAGGEPLPIQLTIADNGSGMSDTTKAQLFTPFASSKEGGKGLGLSLVAAIMKQHDGLIEWESGEKGTKFDLYFAMESV